VERLVDGLTPPCYKDNLKDNCEDNIDAIVACRGTILGTIIIALKDQNLWPVSPEVSSIKMTVNEYADWLDSNVTAYICTLSKSHEKCPAAAEYTERIEQELVGLPGLPAEFAQHFAEFTPKAVTVSNLTGMTELVQNSMELTIANNPRSRPNDSTEETHVSQIEAHSLG
jgi:hypothetical protein